MPHDYRGTEGLGSGLTGAKLEGADEWPEPPLPRPLPPPEGHLDRTDLFVGGGRGLALIPHFSRRRRNSVLLSRLRRATLLPSSQDAVGKGRILRLICSFVLNLVPFGPEANSSIGVEEPRFPGRIHARVKAGRQTGQPTKKGD